MEVKVIDHRDEVIEKMNETILLWLEATGEDAAGVAAKRVPVDTSRLKNSITSAVVASEPAVYIGTNVKYGIYHEFGTGLYAEGESKAKKIPWAYKDDKGNWHYTKGVPARHYLQYGITHHLEDYKRTLEKAVNG